MKTCNPYFTSILFIALCFYCNKTYGQTYFLFPQDSARWCIWNYYGNVSISGKRLLSFEFGTDTIIEGMSYKNILMTRRYSASCCDWGYYFNIDVEDEVLGNIGAMRFDGEKVYYYMYPYSGMTLQCPAETDVLLYDFGLNPGDSAYLQSYDYPHYFHITYEDSIILADGLYHRTLYTDIDGGKTWIEGVGDDKKGLFGTYLFDVLGGDGYDYLAYPVFMQNDVIVYSEIGGDCDLGGINAVTDLSKSYHVYFDNDHTLVLDLPKVSSDYHLHIFDITGKELFSSNVEPKARIDLQFISSGIYMAVMQIKGKTVYTQKFVTAN